MANGNPFLSNNNKNPFLSNTIEPSDTILQRVIGNISAVGPAGAGLSISAPESDIGETTSDITPTALQIPGGMIGQVIGAQRGQPIRGGAIGEAIGRGTGETVRQGFRGVTGKGFDISSIGKEATTGFGTGLAGGTVLKFAGKLFPRQAFKAFGKQVGQRIGNIMKELNESGIKIPGADLFVEIQGVMDDLLGGSLRNRGSAKALQRVVDDEIVAVADASGGGLRPSDVQAATQAVDDIRLGKIKSLTVAEAPERDVVDSQVARAAKKIRDILKRGIDKVAQATGKSAELKQANAAFSNIQKEFPEFGKEIGGLISSIVKAGGVFDVVAGKPGSAISKLVLGEALESQKTPGLLFNAIRGVSQTGSPVIAEGITQGRRNR